MNAPLSDDFVRTLVNAYDRTSSVRPSFIRVRWVAKGVTLAAIGNGTGAALLDASGSGSDGVTVRTPRTLGTKAERPASATRPALSDNQPRRDEGGTDG